MDENSDNQNKNNRDRLFREESAARIDALKIERDRLEAQCLVDECRARRVANYLLRISSLYDDLERDGDLRVSLQPIGLPPLFQCPTHGTFSKQVNEVIQNVNSWIARRYLTSLQLVLGRIRSSLKVDYAYAFGDKHKNQRALARVQAELSEWQRKLDFLNHTPAETSTKD